MAPVQQNESPPARDEVSELLRRARAGEGEAFCELCRPLEGRLFRQAWLLCRDQALAHDLAQDALLAAWKSIHRFDQSCRLFTWIYAILLACHRKHLRKNRRQPVAFSRLSGEVRQWIGGLLGNAAGNAPAPDESCQRVGDRSLLQACLGELPRKNREVVQLRFFAQASLEEIAAVQKCSTGTVKSRLFYGLEKLRKMNRLRELAPPAQTPDES